MGDIIHTAISSILSLFFPEKCVGCGKVGEILCEVCVKGTYLQTRSRNSILYIDELYYWGIYENETLHKALKEFKYRGLRGLEEPFSKMLAEAISPRLYLFKTGSIIVPIPAHKDRKRERGYNQAELLAENVAKKINIPCQRNVLEKIKNTKSQTYLSGEERIFNVKKSFAVSNPDLVKNKKIILVDDITTTGATLSEAAKILKEAGAHSVSGLVVAK